MTASQSDVTAFIKMLFSSIENRQEILRQLLRELITQFEVQRGSVWSVEGGLVVPVFSLNADGFEDDISKSIKHLKIPLGSGFVGKAAETGKPTFRNNLKRSQIHDPQVDIATGHTTNNLISIPLNHGGKTIGVVQLLDRLNRKEFTEKDKNILMREYAPWAAIALDNANIYHDMRANIDFGLGLLSSLDRTAVLRQLLARLILEFNVERGSVWSVEGNKVKPIFSLNDIEEEDEISRATSNLEIELGVGFVGEAAESGLPSYTNEPQFDSRFNSIVDEATKQRTRNMISIPLIREFNTIGVIQLVNRKSNGHFTEEDQRRLMQLFAPWATIALDNANLYLELSELVQTSRHTMSNMLGGVRTDLQLLNESLKSADSDLKQFIEWNTKHLKAYSLSNKELTSLSEVLHEALTRYLKGKNRNIVVRDQILKELPLVLIEKELAILHFYELLTNANKAINDALSTDEIETGIIEITTHVEPNHQIEIRIRNNGVDIPKEDHEEIFKKNTTQRKTEEGQNTSTGLGLWAARKFFNRTGGSIVVESSAQGWTVFLVKLPPVTGDRLEKLDQK